MEVSGQLHVMATLPPGKDTRCPLNRSLGGFYSWTGLSEKEINLLPLPGMDTRLRGRAACPADYAIPAPLSTIAKS